MMKKIISLLLALVLAVGMMSVSVFAAADVTATASVSEANTGGTFKVTVAVNKSGYAGLQIDTTYDTSALTLSKVEMVSGLGGYAQINNGNIIWINGTVENGSIDVTDGTSNTSYTGNVAVLTFKVNGNAAEGNTTVTVKAKAANATEQWVFQDVSASATVKLVKPAYVAGDVDGNGSINIFDAVAVLKYVNNITVSPFIVEAADFDGNGTRNIFDAVAILKHANNIS